MSAGLVKVLDESSSSIWIKSEDVEVGTRAASTEASSESLGDLGDSINPRQIADQVDVAFFLDFCCTCFSFWMNRKLALPDMISLLFMVLMEKIASLEKMCANFVLRN